jgi:hypothetical protein
VLLNLIGRRRPSLPTSPTVRSWPSRSPPFSVLDSELPSPSLLGTCESNGLSGGAGLQKVLALLRRGELRMGAGEPGELRAESLWAYTSRARTT